MTWLSREEIDGTMTREGVREKYGFEDEEDMKIESEKIGCPICGCKHFRLFKTGYAQCVDCECIPPIKIEVKVTW
jgi:hypothetical protein